MRTPGPDAAQCCHRQPADVNLCAKLAIASTGVSNGLKRIGNSTALDGLQRTVYVSGFAKILAPGWRVGYLATCWPPGRCFMHSASPAR